MTPNRQPIDSDSLDLPRVHLIGIGSTLRASGSWRGRKWGIHAECETPDRARLGVRVSPRPGATAEHVADVTVHRVFGVDLIEETQAIASALLWSRLRALAMEREATP